MDLGTMKRKLDGGQYKCWDDFDRDAQLVCNNCLKYWKRHADADESPQFLKV